MHFLSLWCRSHRNPRHKPGVIRGPVPDRNDGSHIEPNVLLVDQDGGVIGLEWEAADVGQGPMKMFGQTIELQSGHPGAEQPHYMLHIYFKADGKVLFGTNDQTAFDPEGICPQTSATATSSASPTAATATATPTAAATAQYAQYTTATPTALATTGGPSLGSPFALVAALALAGSGLAALVFVRRGLTT